VAVTIIAPPVIGYKTETYTGYSWLPYGNLISNRYTATRSFTITRLRARLYSDFTSGEYIKLAIYADNGSGYPGDLIAETSPIEGGGAIGWYSGSITATAIVSGTYYHLAILISSNASLYNLNTGGVYRNRIPYAYALGFPDPFGTPDTTHENSSKWAIYGDDGVDDDFDLSRGGSIVEASDGTKIAVVTNGTTLDVWKDVDSTPVLVDTDIVTNIHGGGAIGWIDAAIDSNDDIKVISSCSTEQTRDVAYAVCDLTTGFGAWEQAADYTEQAPTAPGCAISIDSNDYPHILFVDAVKMTGATADNVYYDYNDGTWSGAEQVGVRAVKTYLYDTPLISHAPSNDVEAYYYGGAPANLAIYRRRNGTWGAEGSYGGIPFMGEVCVTTGDTVYRYHNDTIGDIRENNVDTTYNSDTTYRNISASLVGTDRYIFYIDTSDDVHVISNDGGGTNVYFDVFGISGDQFVTLTDTLSLTDSLTTQRDLVKALTEALGLTDTLTDSRNLFKTITNTLGLTDSINASLKFLVTISNTIGLTDTLTNARNLFKTISNTLGFTDSISNIREIFKTISDTIGLTDSITNVRELFITITDTTGLTDTISKSVGRKNNLSVRSTRADGYTNYIKRVVQNNY
jgi:hypothetical protein